MSSRKEIIKQQSQAVAQENELIQKYIFDMSMQQLKALFYMISQVRPNDPPLTEYQINIRDFCRVCNIDETLGGSSYREIQTMLNGIDAMRAWIREPGPKGKPVKTRLQWFYRLQIVEGTGIINYSFHGDMTRFLFGLKTKYTLFYLENILPLSSKYSIRLYTYLKSFENMRKTPVEGVVIGLDEFKDRFSAQGYERFPDLRRRVIETAVNEINRYTDLRVSCTAEKVNGSRAVNRLRFSVGRPFGEDEELRRERRLAALGIYAGERKYIPPHKDDDEDLL